MKRAAPELVPFDQLVRLERREVSTEPTAHYVEIGVRSHGKGIFHKAPRTGADIGDKTIYRVKSGDFIMQIVFAWEGAIAVAGDDDDGKVGSHRFLTFRVDEQRCSAHYLNWWFKTREALRQVMKISPGAAGRNRTLGSKRLGELKVPLPSVPEQKRIVAWLEGLARRASVVRSELGASEADSEAFMVAVRDDLIGREPKADWVPLSRYVTYLENGWSPLCERRPATDDEWGVLKLSAVTSGTFKEEQNKALPSALEPMPKFEIKSGDFLMSRANTRELVGACTWVRATRPQLMLCDKLFRFQWSNEPSDPRFIEHVLRAPVLRQQIEAACGGTSSTMKNISKPAVLALRVPNLKLKEQERLVTQLERARQQSEKITAELSALETDLAALLPSALAQVFGG
ncbi:MAG: hypothetical protein H7343_22075 [Undibacterium sp.]|nr:hypothetical protein [Opitutaceae bacterium]